MTHTAAKPPPLKVVNLFAGPGAGKSTTAAGLFYLMKARGHRVELVTEAAKDAHYDGRLADQSPKLQNGLFEEQAHRLSRLSGVVDWAVTDSPLLLQMIYAEKVPGMREAFPDFPSRLLTEVSRYEGHNFLIERTKEYQTYGRSQTADEAVQLDREVRRLLIRAGVEAAPVAGDWSAPFRIYEHLFPQAPEEPLSGGFRACSIHDPECEACQ